MGVQIFELDNCTIILFLCHLIFQCQNDCIIWMYGKQDKCFTAADHRSLILSLALLSFSLSYMIINDLLRSRGLDQTRYDVDVDCLMWDVCSL